MFKLKTKVYFDNQSLQHLKQVTGTKAFIVTDPTMESLGYVQNAIDYLKEAGISSVVFSGVRPDPDVNLIAEGLKLYMESSADVVVALGGGSSIDTAKGILYFVWKLGNEHGNETAKPLFVAIPSTSGTGSEVTDFSVVTSKGDKVCLIDEFLAPDIAILDSTCIQHVPQHVIADTGIDVLVHAIEAYLSNKANDFTDALAEKAIKLIFENLEILYKDTMNQNARDHVLNASCLAGMAFTNTGLGINHSLSHALGGMFHISHGRSNALLLNAVIEFNADLGRSANGYAAGRYAKLASVLQLPARTQREGIVSLMLAINKLKKTLGIEETIKSLNIDQKEFENALEQMAENALQDRCTPTNPRKVCKEDLIKILQKSY